MHNFHIRNNAAGHSGLQYSAAYPISKKEWQGLYQVNSMAGPRILVFCFHVAKDSVEAPACRFVAPLTSDDCPLVQLLPPP